VGRDPRESLTKIGRVLLSSQLTSTDTFSVSEENCACSVSYLSSTYNGSRCAATESAWTITADIIFYTGALEIYVWNIFLPLGCPH
jgi:hypothetical protein